MFNRINHACVFLVKRRLKTSFLFDRPFSELISGLICKASRGAGTIFLYLRQVKLAI